MPQVVSAVLPNTQGLLIGKREAQINRRLRNQAHRNECGCGKDHSGESFFQLALRFATSTCKASPCLRAKSDDQERAGRLLTNAKGSLKITLDTAAESVVLSLSMRSRAFLPNDWALRL
jgi:hypothetical protein